MKKKVLIVGGSSGLGLELARLLKEDNNVVITGRTDPMEVGVKFLELHLNTRETVQEVYLDISNVIFEEQPIDLLIYAAGFGQEKSLSDLHPSEISAMLEVGVLAPTMLIQLLFYWQNVLPGFIAITSTSQYLPKPQESVYCAAKAGLGMFANSISLDERIGKTLVVAPGGMQTAFWRGSDKDMTGWMDPKWVAEQIIDIWGAPFSYQMVRILRGPPRVEFREVRE